ncbi:sigma 54-interacting transcriptional regulator [Chondromyces crocatus]|uniref:Protein kinase n=1 Tax=Chondromyces crocatus TaxID=52 RepID=A0A0K1EPU3_CHOCO|nr:sigma 54-interacting transcriptional regulator [Chondromyces crocatus]AKT42628.1 protein kinase [Chondromyces crocatus]
MTAKENELSAGQGSRDGITGSSGPRLPLRYEPLAALGKGGAGEVWAVRDRISGRTVALKALGEGGDEREVMALVREATALSGVEGLGVPRVLRFGRLPESGRPYLVRELVVGTSLADLLEGKAGEAEARLLDPKVWLAAIADAADQLTRLHRALLLHGDVKPANLIVGPDGRATLVDLGLAAPWRDGGVRPEGLTPRYAAPELLEGAPLTVRVEVFALGVTLKEALISAGERLPGATRRALDAVAARATAENPADRYPSTDELGSALRGAAGLSERPPSGVGEEDGASVWPVLGLDGPSGRLLSRIEGMREGGGLLITGPPGSGRSALLRRIAWSLGVAGRAVAWIEAARVNDLAEALAIELSAQGTGREEGRRRTHGIVLVDDAERLGSEALAWLDTEREAGSKLVLVLGVAPSAGQGLPGRTFEIFPMEPLELQVALSLVQRGIPSLSDAVARHVVERSGGWPGNIRRIVARLAGAPVASIADVDRLLAESAVTGGGERDATGDPSRRPLDEIHDLLDRGHFDEAGEALVAWREDRAPEVVIVRARLLTNVGQSVQALSELASVGEEVDRSGDLELSGSWSLNVARALLRTGDYPATERRAGEVPERLGVAVGDEAEALITERGRRLLCEAAALQGLAQSYSARHEEARSTLERSVVLARRTANPRSLSLALGSLAFALQRSERLGEAKEAYEEALGAAEQAGDAGTMATTRLNLAGIAKSQGDLAAAIRHLEAAVDMGRRSGRVITIRQALLNLANLDLYLGRIAKAKVAIDALVADRGSMPPYQRAQLLALEAEHAARSGDVAGAASLCLSCAEAYEAMGLRVDAAEARLERVLLAVGLPGAEARSVLEEVEAAATALGSSGAHRAALALARGRTAALARDEDRARASYEEALKAATVAGQRDWIWRALAARAELEDESGQPLRARRDREAALETLEEISARLPRDLREVFWNDPRRRELRAAARVALSNAVTLSAAPVGGGGEDRLARVLEINRAIAGEHDLERLLEKVTDHAIALLRAERGFVILRSGYARRGGGASSSSVSTSSVSTSVPPVGADGDLSIHASRDQAGDDPHARFSRSIAERVLLSGEPVVTASARNDARMADYVSVHQLMLQSVACVPIRARSGAVIGALYLETRLRPTASFDGELPTLIALADQVAIAIDTARLVGENRRRAEELSRVNEELVAARAKLEELLGQRTAELVKTRRDLRSARAVLRGHFGYEGLVGTSDAMRRLYALIDRVKDADIPVLITGESGTGKEVVARTLHEKSPRGKKPFLGINCGAIPEHLLESELFGHVRGAFTGADRDRKGLFREATEGTLLLDEIGEMPPKMQAGLLRVLQERVVRPVGGAREERVDTRVIAATHRSLAEMVEAGTFREDLYYRLHVVELRLPSLRERLDDVPLLIDHFLGIFAARHGRERGSVSRAALARLMDYRWPGNVRQLENVLLNAWVLSDRSELDVDDFELPDAPPRSSRSFGSRGGPPPSWGEGQPSSRGGARAGGSAPASSGEAATPLERHRNDERERILAALEECNWNRVKAAQIVGLPRRTFYRRLKEYGIQ